MESNVIEVEDGHLPAVRHFIKLHPNSDDPQNSLFQESSSGTR
jgi:hypothetical protein